ncbi:MAG: DUF2088 domain-containing protein [Spirochaetales bacterium]|nr:DUF2088 domain-containing protein [Spirochaetales bacterium]
MIYHKAVSLDKPFSAAEIREAVWTGLEKAGRGRRILMVVPDITRYTSRAGLVAQAAYHYYKNTVSGILVATGTHEPITAKEIKHMFGDIPAGLFKSHNFREDCIELGAIEPGFIERLSGSALSFSFPVQVNRLFARPENDLIVSLGQIVPHEVAGMAGFNKNILVGAGGGDTIGRSHYLGAVCGMEGIMGRPENPVRKLFSLVMERFLNHLPLLYILTVNGRCDTGETGIQGIFVGKGEDVYNEACSLSVKLNIRILEKSCHKIVAFMDPMEYKSTWLANKSIYRSRLALKDGGELIILAPGVRRFGEDKQIDRLIRKYGYKGRDKIIEMVKTDAELKACLAAAAHLIHGSTDGRFTVTYCTSRMDKSDIESVNYRHADYDKIKDTYPVDALKEGKNPLPDGGKIYFIKDPGQGLWASRDRFLPS